MFHLLTALIGSLPLLIVSIFDDCYKLLYGALDFPGDLLLSAPSARTPVKDGIHGQIGSKACSISKFELIGTVCIAVYFIAFTD